MTIDQLQQHWPGETLISRYDRPTGAWILIAVFSTRLGPAGGGTRLKPYPTVAAAVQDAMRLSEGMAYKFAVSGLAWGGGKAVIAVPPNLDPLARPDLLRRYGTLIRQLSGLFYTGPDVGTAPEDMDIVAETGAPYVFGRTPAAGGAGESGIPTALGVFSGIKVTCEQLFGTADLSGRRVLVQGTGSVGRTLVGHLCQAGAEVLFSEIDKSAIAHFRDEVGLEFVPESAVYATACDIFAPCALGAILNAETIPQLNCRAVAGGANNQLATLEDAGRLHRQGILYVPDYVLNVGGAMAVLGIETQGWDQARVEREVSTHISRALRQVFEVAAAEYITPEAAARHIANRRLAPDG